MAAPFSARPPRRVTWLGPVPQARISERDPAAGSRPRGADVGWAKARGRRPGTHSGRLDLQTTLPVPPLVPSSSAPNENTEAKRASQGQERSSADGSTGTWVLSLPRAKPKARSRAAACVQGVGVLSTHRAQGTWARGCHPGHPVTAGARHGFLLPVDKELQSFQRKLTSKRNSLYLQVSAPSLMAPCGNQILAS